MRGPSRTRRPMRWHGWPSVFEPGDAMPDGTKSACRSRLSNGGAGRCEIEHRTAIAAETARRLCCDAGVPVVDGPNGEPLTSGAAPAAFRPRYAAHSQAGCPLPRLSCDPAPPRPPRPALDRRRRDLARQPRPALPDATTASCTRAASTCSASTTARSGSPTPMEWPSVPRSGGRLPHPTPSSSGTRPLGIAIDCETATAHWHGERIDYDHALMVSMASWDSGDTRPEAGPATGDWNPS